MTSVTSNFCSQNLPPNIVMLGTEQQRKQREQDNRCGESKLENKRIRHRQPKERERERTN